MRETQFGKHYKKVEKTVALRGCQGVADTLQKYYLLNLEKARGQERIKLSSKFFYDLELSTLYVNDYQLLITLDFLRENGILIPNQELGEPLDEEQKQKYWGFYLFGEMLFLWEINDNYLISVSDMNGGMVYTPANPKKTYGKAKQMKKGKRKLQKFKRK